MAKITITIADKFNAISNKLAEMGIDTLTVGAESFDVAEFLTDRAEKSVKKKSGEPSKASVENKVLAENVYDYMLEVGKGIKASDLIGKVDGVASTSKAVVVLKVLIADGRVKLDKVKGTSVYSLCE